MELIEINFNIMRDESMYLCPTLLNYQIPCEIKKIMNMIDGLVMQFTVSCLSFMLVKLYDYVTI